MTSIPSLTAQRRQPLVVSGKPTFERPDSQLVSASQIYEPACQKWFSRLGHGLSMDRKLWEYAYILQAIHTYGLVLPGARGVSFGCGKELAVSILAAEGCEILATDYVPDLDSEQTWEARGLDDLFFRQIIDREAFEKCVSFRHLDMNSIDEDIRGFDFCWSTGSLEHIGSHANGLAFIENAMACLKPGGIAVHTTEFTVSSDTVSYDSPELSFYCRADIESLAERLLGSGHLIILNFDRGTTLADTHVDLPPYHYGRTLAAHFHSHVITSIGLIIQKGR